VLRRPPGTVETCLEQRAPYDAGDRTTAASLVRTRNVKLSCR
jgi:hypothetical protein